THVRQKHSLDILFIEFLQVVFWFNPLFWLSKKSIKLNHEFLADRGALENDSDVYHYQNILLSYASSTDHAALESPFNYSLTKKRILMLSNTMSRKRAIVSALLLVPVLTGCVLAFNNAIVAVPEITIAHPIEGAWIDHANENRNVSIYERNDTLWWDQVVMKVPILINNNAYAIQSAGDIIPLSLTANNKLKMGSVYFTRPEDAVSYRIDGVWEASDTSNTYTFNTKNGQPSCDIINKVTGKSTHYYPKLIANGMQFTVGGELLIFTIKNENLIMQDGSVLDRTKNNSVYKTLDNQERSYAHNFIAGAKRNGRKALVIEIRNNKISVSGRSSSLQTMRKDIDAQTKNWEEQEYTEAAPSFLFKDNTANFLKEANSQFKKTHFSKANEGMILYSSLHSHTDTKKQNTAIEEYNTWTKKHNGSSYETITSKEKQKPVTKAEIKEYNRLATKYANYSKGKIRQGEVVRMYDIYSRMTAAQKKTAKAYPALPPPPPPPTVAPPKVKKGEKSDIPPPPPPAPPTPVKLVKGIKSTLPPPPPSPEEHFVKMRKLGGIFFYEKKEITFDQAVKLVNENDHLNIKTPYPYSKPPKTFITKTKVVPGKRTPKPKKDDRDPKEEENKSPKLSENVQQSGLLDETHKILGHTKPEDQVKAHAANNGVFFVNGDSVSEQEALNFLKVAKAKRVRLDKKTEPKQLLIDVIPDRLVYAPISKERIENYNELARKYSSDTGAKIKKKELRALYHIYI
ncbi:MAG: hypothetical protein ACI81G_000917, partial [Gammaproteobacteria bacterium]